MRCLLSHWYGITEDGAFGSYSIPPAPHHPLSPRCNCHYVLGLTSPYLQNPQPDFVNDCY
jgi:hypothetical protein